VSTKKNLLLKYNNITWKILKSRSLISSGSLTLRSFLTSWTSLVSCSWRGRYASIRSSTFASLNKSVIFHFAQINHSSIKTRTLLRKLLLRSFATTIFVAFGFFYGTIVIITLISFLHMDSLKFHPGSPCPTFLRLVGGPPLKRPHSRFRGNLPAGWRPAAVFYPFGRPTPYAYAFLPWLFTRSSLACSFWRKKIQLHDILDIGLPFGWFFPSLQT
jgi:hypothetical protein